MSATRWVWIPVDRKWALAFLYTDKMAGPSAKGAVIDNPPTMEQIREAIDRPNRTFRDPARFGAVPIGAEAALQLGLPKDPPWIGHFEDKPVPPPRGEPSRTVVAVVTQHGQVVRGAEVRIGHVHGNARELLALDTRLSDADGRCVFPLAEVKDLAIHATTSTAGSKLVEVGQTRDLVELPLLAFGALEGMVTKQGRPVVGSVSITGRDGGVHHVRRGDPTGTYRIEGVIPGEYDVRVEGIDPSTHMTAGTPTLDRVVLLEGQRVRRAFVRVAGSKLVVRRRVEHNSHNG
ncbi:MAG: carboxypeptidase-like regulatory domain-containing protein, partial [Kofleriaceae bacterium]